MFCTNCQTHFDWVDGRILKNSSNTHYLNLQQFSQNVVTRDLPDESHIRTSTCHEFSLYRDKVDKDDLDLSQLDPNLVHCLWDDSNTIRYIKRKIYHEATIEQEISDSLQELQVKYLLSEITETAWSQRVYQAHMKRAMVFLYGDVLNLYLATVEIYQAMFARPRHAGVGGGGSGSVARGAERLPGPPAMAAPVAMVPVSYSGVNQVTLLAQYGLLVNLCNTSFQSIHDEYGGTLHHIRHPEEPQIAPAFI